MNKSNLQKLLLFLILILSLCSFANASAETKSGNKVVFGSDYELEKGDTLDGNIVIVGSKTKLNKNSTVNGDIVLFGGDLQIEGTVNGDIVAFGGAVDLKSTALINGDFSSFGANVDRHENAVITGDTIRQNTDEFKKSEENIVEQKAENAPDSSGKRGFFGMLFFFITKTVIFTVEILVCAALAVIANLLFEKHLTGTCQAFLKFPLESLGIGLLTVIALPFVQLFFCITVVLIPLAILLAFIFVILCLYAWIAAGHEIGKRLAQVIKVNWPVYWTTALGTFTLSFVLFGFSKILPCIGWIPAGLVIVTGVGAIIIYHGRLFQNRKGSKTFLPKNENSSEVSIPKETRLSDTSTKDSVSTKQGTQKSDTDVRPQDSIESNAFGSMKSEMPIQNLPKVVPPDVIELGPSLSEQKKESTDISDHPVENLQKMDENEFVEEEFQSASKEPQQPATEKKSAEKRKTDQPSDKQTNKKRGIGSSILDSIHEDISEDSEQK